MGVLRAQGSAAMSGRLTELPTDAEEKALREKDGPVAARPRTSDMGQRDVPAGEAEDDPFKDTAQSKRISEREEEYRAQRTKRMLSPERADPFADSTPAPEL